MGTYIDSWQIQRIIDEWAKEVNKDFSYKVIKKDVFVYADSPGYLIGRAGERINRYEKLLKEFGVSKVNIVEVKNARIPEYTYGMEVCPLADGGACYDYDRLGTIACGICGANKALAADGQECFLNGMKHMMENADKL